MKRKCADAGDTSVGQPVANSDLQEPTEKKHKSSALDLIQQYDDDEDEEASTDDQSGVMLLSSQRLATTDEIGEIKKTFVSVKRIQLHVPREISTMFQCGESDPEDPTFLEQKHEGRIRTFPHVRGNWASFIHIPVHGGGIRNSSAQLMTDLMLETFSANSYQVNTLDSIHLSLSRTHVFLHHWIQPFIDELRRKLTSCHKQEFTFHEFIILVNDEKTRTFVGMKVWDCPYLRTLVDIADECLKEYKLEPYYKEPIFHISLGWLLGDQSENLKPVVEYLNERWNALIDDDASIATLSATAIAFKYGHKMPLFCRFYKEKYPEVDEVVMVNVKRIAEMGAYVHLLEYNNIEGMILLSELSRRRIRSVNKLIRIGKTEPVVVIRVDKEKGYIDLSKRRVAPEDVEKCNEQFSKAKAVNSILRHVADLLGYESDAQLEELYMKTAWHFEEKYKKKASAYDAFKQAVQEPSVFDECGLDENTKTVLLNNIRQKLMLQSVKIRADIEVSCYSYEGIEAVKKALRAGMALSTEQMPVKINLIAPPLYVVTTSTPEKPEGIALLQEAIKAIKETILSLGGSFNVKLEPKVVTALDEEEFAKRLLDLEQQNEERAADDDGEDEIDDEDNEDDGGEAEEGDEEK